jgi:hypothetical protein
MSDYQEVRLQCSHGPDLRFQGRIVHEFTTQRKDGGKDRWTELRLWETPAGNWIAENVGRSSRQGDFDIREAAVIDFNMLLPGSTREQAYTDGEWAATHGEKEPERIPQVMDAFGWTTAAKAFAREMGWDVILRVA